MSLMIGAIQVVEAATTLPVVSISTTGDPLKDNRTTEQWRGLVYWSVNRSGDVFSALTVNYTVIGTATPGVDYKALSGTVVIPAGSSTAEITTRAIADRELESDETIIITLASNPNYTLSSSSSVTGYVIDNPPPLAPSDLIAVGGTPDTISLSWKDNSQNESGFIIERKLGSTGTYTEIATLGEGVITYDDAGLSSGKTYYYRVRATNAVGDSGYSNEASVATVSVTLSPPAAPTELILSVVSSSQIDLNWTDHSSREGGFKIERKEGATGVYTQVGIVGANVTVYHDGSLLANSLYFYRVRATSDAGDSIYSNEASATTLDVIPSAPSGLALSVISSSQINLSWVDNASNESGYKIERKTGTAAFAQIAVVGANITSFNDAGLAASTSYTYRVRATNSVGNSGYSNQSSATTLSAAFTLPAAPTALSLSVISASQINLSWVDHAGNESGFLIERKTGTAAFAQIGSVNANVTTYSDAGLSPKTTYVYRVRAKNEKGNSAYSNNASAKTLDLIPLAPTGLTASVISTTQINLAWNDNANNETGYKVERRKGVTGSYTLVATVGVNVKRYYDTGLTPNTQYSYRVCATNAVGDSSYAEQPSVTTNDVAPPAPTGLAVAVVSSSQLNLSWVYSTTGITGFKIERRTGSDAFVEIATVGASVTHYSNTGLNPNTRYYYRVRAYKPTVFSAYTTVASAATKDTIPAAPSGLTLTVLSTSQIKLSWTDRSNNESTFRIERKIGSGAYKQAGYVTSNVQTFTDTGLAIATQYTYRVRARNAIGDSPYSNEAVATTQDVKPAAPAGLELSVVSASQINLVWILNSINETGVKIERKTGVSGIYTTIATLGPGIWRYNNTGLTANTLYTYRVRATNAIGDSPYSNEKSAVATAVDPNIPRLAELAWNPFNKMSAHHRPIGAGAEYGIPPSCYIVDYHRKRYTVLTPPGAKDDNSILRDRIGLFQVGSTDQGRKYEYPVCKDDPMVTMYEASQSFPAHRTGPTYKMLMPLGSFIPGGAGWFYPKYDGRDFEYGFRFKNGENVPIMVRFTDFDYEHKQYSKVSEFRLDGSDTVESRGGTCGASRLRWPGMVLTGRDINGKNPGPIQHALMCTATRHNRSGADEGAHILNKNVVWPSAGIDSTADPESDRYLPGAIENRGFLPYGTRLCIRPQDYATVSAAIGSNNKRGQALLETFVYYGCYIVDGQGQYVTKGGDKKGVLMLRVDGLVGQQTNGVEIKGVMTDIEKALEIIRPYLYPLRNPRTWVKETELDLKGLPYAGGGGPLNAVKSINTAFDAK